MTHDPGVMHKRTIGFYLSADQRQQEEGHEHGVVELKEAWSSQTLSYNMCRFDQHYPPGETVNFFVSV